MFSTGGIVMIWGVSSVLTEYFGAHYYGRASNGSD